MSSLALLREKRMRFAGGSPDRRAECKRIYMEAFERIGRQAEYIDQLNATRLDPISMVFSSAFRAQEQELARAIEAEWLSDDPDLTRFTNLVATWEQRCNQELATWQVAVKSQ